MEILFAPWRMHYIKRAERGDTGTAAPGCVLCGLHTAPASEDAANLLLHRDDYCFVVLNLYPYNTAHAMVVPYAHAADLPALAAPIAANLFALTQRVVGALTAEYQPAGVNIGMNIGQVSGGSINDHLHMHIVPRWNGDTNFLPIVAGTKLIPEDLPRTYERLRPYFAA